MSDIESSDWSPIANNNNQAPPNGFPEGQAPSSVNNCTREMMAALRRDYERRNPTITSTGSANAQVLTYSVAPAAYVAGQRFSFTAGFSNTAAATLNINGLGAAAIQFAGAALIGGEIVAGLVIELVYDGTQFQILASPGLLNSIRKGKLQSTGTFTLNSGATSTTLTDANISATSVIHWMPTTAHAATATANLYCGTVGSGTATLTHANTADVDKTFTYVVLGP